MGVGLCGERKRRGRERSILPFRSCPRNNILAFLHTHTHNQDRANSLVPALAITYIHVYIFIFSHNQDPVTEPIATQASGGLLLFPSLAFLLRSPKDSAAGCQRIQHAVAQLSHIRSHRTQSALKGAASYVFATITTRTVDRGSKSRGASLLSGVNEAADTGTARQNRRSEAKHPET